jgi:hypothetical protein
MKRREFVALIIVPLKAHRLRHAESVGAQGVKIWLAH